MDVKDRIAVRAASEAEDAATLPAASRVSHERLAWLIFWGCFAVFVFCAAFAGFFLLQYWETALDPQDGSVVVVRGTVLVKGERQQDWVSALTDIRVGPGDYVRTDSSSQAFVTFFDHSTLVVSPDSEVGIVREEASRFAPRREYLELKVTKGRVHLGVAPPRKSEKFVAVTTKDGTFALQEGSYFITVLAERSQLRVAERGQAQLQTDGGSFVLQAGQRMTIGQEGIRGPLVGFDELVKNANFTQGLDSWYPASAIGFKEGADVLGQYELVSRDGRPAVHFSRAGSGNTHYEVYLYQEINRDVEDFSDLRLSLDLRLDLQAQSGGGYFGSEYPAWVQITYEAADSIRNLRYGFYIQNAANNRTDSGVPTAQGEWAHFEAPLNLMTLVPQPLRILSIQVGGSGWDFDSYVSQVSLAGR